jgi:hypothetical protein
MNDLCSTKSAIDLDQENILYVINPIFIMAKDNDSNKYSKENYNLLNGMKRYLRIEHKDDDKDLLDYLRKRAGLLRE